MKKISDVKDVVCGFVDYGLFNELAVQISQQYKHVFYYNPSWKNAFPSSKDITISEGFDNITVIKDFWNYKKYFDLVWFPDIYDGDTQEELKSQGIPVWGAGKTEWLERDRFKTTEWQKSIGLPTPERKKIIGIDAARALPKGWHIKINEFRDDAETFRKLGNQQMDAFWDALALILGHRKNTYIFMAEKDIPDAVEFGSDMCTVRGNSPLISLYGIERKGSAYLGKMARTNKLPQSLKKVNDALSTVFKEENTECDFSTEVRVTKKLEGFLIDPCIRKGNPPFQSQMEIIKNQATVAWAGANGELEEYEFVNRYCAQATMTSEFAAQSELAFEFPDSIRRFVKIKNVCKADGVYYYIPNKGSKITTVGAIVGLGSTKEEAVENCKKNASEVKAFQLEIDTYALDEAIEETQKANKDFGFNF